MQIPPGSNNALTLVLLTIGVTGCAGTLQTRVGIGTQEVPHDAFGGYPYKALVTDASNIIHPKTLWGIDHFCDSVISIPCDFIMDTAIAPIDLVAWSYGHQRDAGRYNEWVTTSLVFITLPFDEPNYVYKKSDDTYSFTHGHTTCTSSDCRAFVPGWTAGSERMAHQRALELKQKIDEAAAKGRSLTLTPEEHRQVIMRPYIPPSA